MLIAVLALVGMLGIFFLVNGLSAASIQQQRDAATANALAQAKEALIGRAVADSSLPGSLPCPDTNDDGSSELFAGIDCPAYLGRLPWRTLGLPDLRDGNGERLWYALSPSLRDHPSARPINSNTPGNLMLDATIQVAAIVFAPGPPLAGQSRPSNSASDYLDGSNALPNQTNFASGPAGGSFNDRTLAITRDELFRSVTKRVLAEMRGTTSPVGSGLLQYQASHGGVFPWADTTNDYSQDSPNLVGKVPVADLIIPPATWAWLQQSANGWPALVSYSLQPGQTTMTIDLNGISITCTPTLCQ